jgi:preprotein translocase subunit SecG
LEETDLKTALTILYLIICIAIVVIVMLQDSKGQGLAAALSGNGGGTYWSKNKGRSKEGMLNKLTIVLAVLFIILSVVLSLDALQ